MSALSAPEHEGPSRLRCRACGCEEIDRLVRGGMRDYLASILSLYPFRCRRCAHEFYLSHRGTEDQNS